jgi:hypothetical protein
MDRPRYVPNALQGAIREYAAAVEARRTMFNQQLNEQINQISLSVDQLIGRLATIQQEIVAKDREIAELRRQPNAQAQLDQTIQQKTALEDELNAGIAQLGELRNTLNNPQPFPAEINVLRQKVEGAIRGVQAQNGGSKSRRRMKKRNKRKSKRK